MKKNIIIAMLFIIIIGLGGYLVYDKVIKKDTKSNQSTTQYITEEKTYLDTIDQRVVEMMAKIENALDYQCGTDSVYLTQKKVKVENLSNEFVYKTAMETLTQENKNTISAEKLEQAIKNTFGKNYKFEHKTYNSCPSYTYDSVNKIYQLAQEGCGGTCGPNNIKEITKVIKTKKTIEVYEKVIFTNAQTIEGNQVPYYKENNLKELLGYLTTDDIGYNEENEKKLLAQGSLYKFTFKLEDGNYVFLSSELQ